jgi:hypothetical protein
MKIIGLIFLAIVLIGIAIGSFFYFGTYSKGIRAGVVMKVSEKGFVFKTYEGQMNIGSFGAIRQGQSGSNDLSTTFDFSVANKQIYDELSKVALSGERVNLEYEEKYAKFFWLGETKYFVTRVERLGTPPAQVLPAPADSAR